MTSEDWVSAALSEITFPWAPSGPAPSSMFPWALFGANILAQFVLTCFFFLFVGSQRNSAAAMGGSDSDNVTREATVKKGSPLAVILAYNILAIVYASTCSYVGTKSWFDGTAASVGDTLQDRFYAYSEPYARIATLTIAYETYNTLAVIFLHEYRNAAFIFHHSTCLVLGLISLAPFCHYYATFFFGLTALSSVPLALIELFQAAKMPAMQEHCRVLFCIIFLIFRTVYWPIESYKYWVDELAAFDGAAPIHNHAAHYFLLFANVGLTGLQFYWTTLIFKGIAEKFSPSKDKAA